MTVPLLLLCGWEPDWLLPHRVTPDSALHVFLLRVRALVLELMCLTAAAGGSAVVLFGVASQLAASPECDVVSQAHPSFQNVLLSLSQKFTGFQVTLALTLPLFPLSHTHK